MPFYEDMQKVVSDVLGGEFKQGSIEYIQLVPGAGPVDDPGPSTEVHYNINGTASGVKYKYVVNGQAIASDLQIVAPVDPRYIPVLTDFVSIDGVKYKIHQLLPKPAAGTPVAYLFIVRK